MTVFWTAVAMELFVVGFFFATHLLPCFIATWWHERQKRKRRRSG